MNTPLDGFRRLLAAIDRLELRYFVAGSVASSFHGLLRYTNDVDLVVAIVLDSADDFVNELIKEEFYVDGDTIRCVSTRMRHRA
jgi:hypothetical protein